MFHFPLKVDNTRTQYFSADAQAAGSGCGSAPEQPAIPTAVLRWEEFSDRAASENMRLPDTPDGLKTSFQVFVIPDLGIQVQITLDYCTDLSCENRDDDIYIFFQGIPEQNNNAYCNIFGHSWNANSFHTNLFYLSSRGKICSETPFIAVKLERSVPENGRLQVTIPWADIASMIPFDPENGTPVWKWNIVRISAGHTASWHGTMHVPNSWGNLEFPDFSEDQKKTVLKAVLRQNASFIPVFQMDFCSKESFELVKEKRIRQLKELFATAEKSSLSLEELTRLAAESDLVRSTRKLIACSVPSPQKNQIIQANGKKWVLARSTEILQDCEDLYMLHFVLTENKHAEFLMTLPDGSFREFTAEGPYMPLHQEIGKCPAGFLWKLYTLQTDMACAGSAESVKDIKVKFLLVDMKNHLLPEKPANLWKPGVTEHQASCGPAGIPHPNMINLCRAYSRRFTADHARTIFLGDSIFQYFVSPAWDRLSLFHPGNAGVEGDTIQGALWRMDRTDLE